MAQGDSGGQLRPPVGTVDTRDLPHRPYLKPWQRAAQANGRLVFEYAESAVVFEGAATRKLLPVLLPLLDGTRTVDEINDMLGEAAAPAVANAIAALSERGLLVEGPPLPEDVPSPVADTVHFLAATGNTDSLTECEAELGRATVVVLGDGSTAHEVAKLLEAAGVGDVSRADWALSNEPSSSAETDLTVVAPEPIQLPRLEGWNRQALESRSRWLQVLPFDGQVAVVGPLYVPDETCCYECYLRRRAANVNFPYADFRSLEEVPASYPSPPPLRHMVAGLAAMLTLQWLSDGMSMSQVPGTMHALGWNRTVQLSSHYVYRVPRCPVCFADQGTPSPWHA